jgi:hypothetical protein
MTVNSSDNPIGLRKLIGLNATAVEDGYAIMELDL